MSTVPLETIIRPVRTAALGSEIVTHRIDSAATRWVATGHDSPDATPGHDTETPRQDATRTRGKKKDKNSKPRLTRRTRATIVTLIPVAVLLLAMRPSSIGALLACAGLYLLTVVTWGYSPTAALITTYAALATMWPASMTLVALIWIPTSYVIGSRDPLNVADDEATDEERETPAEDRLITLVRHLIGDRYGVHLRDIVEALNQASPEREFTAPEVRAALAQRGVPTRAKVRAPQGGIPGSPETVTRGVHRDDLPAAPEPSETRPDDPSHDPSPDTPAEPVATSATSL